MQADHEAIKRRLKTARGQIDGLIKMVEEDRYCLDISNQLLATQALLKRANEEVLRGQRRGEDRRDDRRAAQNNEMKKGSERGLF